MTVSTPLKTLTLSQATKAILAGRLIAYPTETVYGLGCRADQIACVEQLALAKNRDHNQSFIVLVASIEKAATLIAPQDHRYLTQAQATWPGPTTWVFTAAQHVNPALTLHGNIALRISPHPLVQALCQRSGCPIISTSANHKGQPPIKTPAGIWEAFHHVIAGVMTGEPGHNKPSRIIDARSGKNLRD